ncbi:MAG: LysM peptidoglycan-binding domain-containing protein [Candidatus Woesebacteria bacterium]|nr:MAG: LysM peptidoglycan-binding domain-containing protein [Candidatus Woesebacteria bacterium]
MNFDLKKFLKNLKLNEENISMVLGALVIVVVGVLIVNYFKDKKGETLNGASVGSESQKEHIVVKGETLWSIAEDKYGSGYNWVDVKKANELKSDTIEVGQKLTLPEVSAKKPTSTKPTLTAKVETVSGDTYTVVKGDTLWSISLRAYGDGYKWVSVAKANNLVNPNVIHVGNVLTLPR